MFKNIKNRKGFAYIITVSFLVVIILTVFLTLQQYTYQDKQDAYEMRIRSLDDFITDFDSDIHRAVYITSFRTLLAMEDMVATSGTFVNNTEDLFSEIFVNGTLNGTSLDIMNDSSMSDYLTKVNILAGKIGIRSNITLINVTLSQSSPWNVDVFLTLNLEINDTRGLASWSFNHTYETAVPIYDLRDPIYSSFTANRVPNTIRYLDVPFFVNDSDNDTANFIMHANDSYYVASTSAPSFLQRFENNVSASPYGIESLVNVETISDQELEVYSNRVKVDYIYFNDISVSNVSCNFTNVPSSLYVVLPQNRLTLYDLDGLNYSTSCS